MNVELLEIRDFLAAHHPFDVLPQAALDRLPAAISVRYLRRGSAFPPQTADREDFYLVRRGAVEFRDASGELVDKLGDGSVYATTAIVDDSSRTLSALAVEDTLLYLLPRSSLDALRSEHPQFDQLLSASIADRMRRALASMRQSLTGAALTNMEIGDLVVRAAVSVPPDTSVRSAAARMREQRISSLLIVDNGRLAGVVTDRDLRNRCIAEGMDTGRPVRDIMTSEVHTVASHAPAFEALMSMARLNVHHLPVLDRDRLVGVVSVSDLVRHESANAVYLAAEVRKAVSRESLVGLSRKLPELQIRLAASGATARHVGEAISAITDAITVRLIELAETVLGPPPIRYAWVAGGSQARREQTSHSDQDNAMILADDPDAKQSAYFAALARSVNDGLDACGFVYCPGAVMASNPKWRQSVAVWRTYFGDWIGTPEPMALMLSSVFFDLRAVYGDAGLLQDLQRENLESTRASGIFLAYMAGNALKHRPPLGFFRNLVLVSGGDHDQTLDLKHRGVVPVVDLARVYALAEGASEINTIDRLRAVAGSTAISQDGARSLVDAYQLIATLRVQHQAEQLRKGEAADNFLPPKALSALERAHLKDAFDFVSQMQRTLSSRFPTARFF